MRRHLVRLAPAPVPLPLWQSLVEFCLPCAPPGNEGKMRIYGGWVKTPVLFLPVCRPKFTKFPDNAGELLHFPTPCPIVYAAYLSEDIAH